MRITVDRDLCESNAVCVGVADDIFDLDDEDLAVVKSDPIPADREDAARQAVTLCPKVALILHDD
ncbi:ferredoxin [Mycolicibacterium sp. 018/SC-01/001]|uniref:ferredoxin n=1 Tax=Mycolicibacterium sp. 018/SC-01/001 TaxID=2592069 RepID=UPI00117E8EDA|nr:ferredoxin [Mycolicibacterium sp. 018/SC-01/001]TRW76765.1 ferredoxin [Mycolicibacterium sp. 018/SC-01/001]